MGMHEGGKIAVGCVTWDQFKVGPYFRYKWPEKPGFPWSYFSSTYRVTLGFQGDHLGGSMVNTGSSGLIGG